MKHSANAQHRATGYFAAGVVRNCPLSSNLTSKGCDSLWLQRNTSKTLALGTIKPVGSLPNAPYMHWSISRYCNRNCCINPFTSSVLKKEGYGSLPLSAGCSNPVQPLALLSPPTIPMWSKTMHYPLDCMDFRITAIIQRYPRVTSSAQGSRCFTSWEVQRLMSRRWNCTAWRGTETTHNCFVLDEV